MFCPQCGKPAADGQRFCGYCGTSLERFTLPQQQTWPPQPTPPQQPQYQQPAPTQQPQYQQEYTPPQDEQPQQPLADTQEEPSESTPSKTMPILLAFFFVSALAFSLALANTLSRTKRGNAPRPQASLTEQPVTTEPSDVPSAPVSTESVTTEPVDDTPTETELAEKTRARVQAVYGRPAFSSSLPTGSASFERSRQAWPGDEEGYWHAKLKGRQHQLYDRLLPHIRAFDTEFSLGTLDDFFENGSQFDKRSDEDKDAALKALNDDCCAAEQAIAHDHPELFWFKAAAHRQYYWRTDGKGGSDYSVTDYSECYIYGADEAEELKSKVEDAVGEALSHVRRDVSDYEQAADVYQWLAENVQYNQEVSDQLDALRDGTRTEATDRSSMRDEGQTVVSSLVERSTVCTGYARAYQLILSQLGIPCTTVSGYRLEDKLKKEDSRHSWNLVCLGGACGYADVTRGDMGETYSYSDELISMELPGVYWKCFFMTDDECAFDRHEAAMDERDLPNDFPSCDTEIWEDGHFEVLESGDVTYDEDGNPLVWSWRERGRDSDPPI